MGQNNSRPNSVLRTAMETPNYKEKLKFASSIKTRSPQKDHAPEPQSCVNVFCRAKPDQNEPEWKRFLQKKLNNPNMNYWPELLLQALKKHDAFQADEIYQADVQWAAYHENNNSPIIKEFTIEPFSTDTIENRNTTSPYKSKKPSAFISDQINSAGKSAKSLEATSEEILVHIKDPEWMKESFDIKIQEDREAMMSSMRQLKDSRKSSKSSVSKKSRHSRTSIRFSRTSSAAKPRRSHYENFTILFEPPSHNGSPQNNTSAYQEALTKYKSVLSTIERHFETGNYIFRKIIDAFEEYFATRYMKVVKQYEESSISADILSRQTEAATGDVQYLVGTLYEVIVMYYMLEKIKQDNLMSFGKFINRDNVINFLTSILFKGRIYSTLFKLYCLEYAETEALYKKSVNICKYYKPEDFGISEEYCLNDKTIQYVDKKKSEQSVGMVSVPNFPENRAAAYYIDRKTTSTKFSDELEEIDGRLFDGRKPYRTAILQLQNLKNMRSPLHKLKSIMEAAEQVSKCIKEFYHGLGMPNENRLDPDQTLSIFMYLVVHSRLENVSAHCKIIEKFSTNNVLNSMSGYYAATIGACVEYISDMGADSEQDSKSDKESVMREERKEI